MTRLPQTLVRAALRIVLHIAPPSGMRLRPPSRFLASATAMAVTGREVYRAVAPTVAAIAPVPVAGVVRGVVATARANPLRSNQHD